MKKKKLKIVYTGDIEELFSLSDEYGNLDDDTIYDWLMRSKNLKFNSEVRSVIIRDIRKRKLDKINKTYYL